MNRPDSQRDVAKEAQASLPGTLPRYATPAENIVRRTLAALAVALDAGNLTAAQGLLEAMPAEADRDEFGMLYDGFPDWMQLLVPRVDYLSTEFLTNAARRGMTPMQWAAVEALLRQGVPQSAVEDLRALGTDRLVCDALKIESCPIRHLPPGLSVRLLALDKLESLEEIPADLEMGEFWARECAALVGIPTGYARPLARIRVTLCPNFALLPARLAVEEDCIIYRSERLTEIPGGTVGRNMYILHCSAFTSVSSDLFVTGNAQFYNCRSFRRLVKSPTSKRLEVSGCQVFTHLPGELQLEELKLEGSPVSNLPKGLVVGKLDLDLDDLEGLPDDLRVTDELRCPARFRRDVERLRQTGAMPDAGRVDYIEPST